MKIIGVFRGFPGLGRMMSGTEIIRMLIKEHGAEATVFTYYQGSRYALTSDLRYDNYRVDARDISSMGIVPVSRYGEHILRYIEDNDVDLAIVDGEPLMIEAIKVNRPQCGVVALLNPKDWDNPSNTESSMAIFRHLYRMADRIIIHGFEPFSYCSETDGICHTNTIIRREILSLERRPVQKSVCCILGGGTSNVSESFRESTLALARLVVETARIMVDFEFTILCSGLDLPVGSASFGAIPPNVSIISDICSVIPYYERAGLVITRAGRNTLSELLALGIPGLVCLSGDSFREGEQKRNIEVIESLTENIVAFRQDCGAASLSQSILDAIARPSEKRQWEPGNIAAFGYIEDFINARTKQ